ncbi:LysR family transcriptional regulator [Caballeronia sordidicola]|uniref:Putative transcription regulator protein of MDR efflux pump cluster n=1 Tax=Caballeronia sordidicola TaxID=196367 RepID=A0A242M5B6_CABSO|nr:LysR family transcriptional regulator [Caballeronia sordidicola]OTP66294.1 putative transcription regulator protein of MDR efflux pump cluster [Caballeronia sordidicola]
MDRLQAMQVFTKIVEMNSFSRAADSLNLPHASTTTIIKNLEAHLRVRLMQRTTRRLNLTPEGAEYYERCTRILAEIDETEDALSNTGKGPRGKLRIDMPGSVGRLVVMPRLPEFRERYPDIELMVGFGDKPVDLVQEGVDCAIRVGELEDSSLVARRLGVLQTLTAASPAYIEQYGEPTSLDNLRQHHAVQYFSNGTGRMNEMSFVIDKETTSVKMRGTLAVNDGDAYVMCGVQGAGIIQSPRFMLLPHLRSGALVEVLPQWKPAPMPIAAVYPHNRHLAPKVRVFVEWIAMLFESCPLMSSVVDQEGRCVIADAQYGLAPYTNAHAVDATVEAFA